ncbi:MAG: DAK2 domain-containing protein [Candidatus Hydrothermia bacterium]
MTVEVIRGNELRKALLSGIIKVQDLREELDRINVFPVPDGDTGTNLAATLSGGIPVLREATNLKLCEILKRFSEALLFSAKGNSGTIISQFFWGLADAVKGKDSLTVCEFSQALKHASNAVYDSLENPVEGTVITVIRECADYALKICSSEKDFRVFLKKLHQRAEEVLRKTPELLPKLKEKNVIDAGAYGFVLLLRGIIDYILGKKVETVHDLSPSSAKIIEEEDIEHRYCTEAVIKVQEGFDKKKLALILGALGSSILIAGAGGLFKIHIHTNWPQKVLEVLKEKGTLLKQKIDDMLEMNILAKKKKLGIVVDSSSDIPYELAQEYGIQIIPLQILMEGKSFIDGVDIDRAQVLEKLIKGERITTSQPDYGTVDKVIKEALSKSQNLLVISLSSKLSGTYNAIRIASSKYANVRLFDSRSLTLGITLLALRAIEKFEEGYEIEEIQEHLKNAQKKSFFILTLNTVKYLVKSGRISNLKGGIAEVLGIKPLISISTEGTLENVGKALGIRHALRKIEKMLKSNLNPFQTYDFGIAYCGKQPLADELEDFIRENFKYRRIIKNEVGPLLSIYAGPGAFGVVALPVF